MVKSIYMLHGHLAGKILTINDEDATLAIRDGWGADYDNYPASGFVAPEPLEVAPGAEPPFSYQQWYDRIYENGGLKTPIPPEEDSRRDKGKPKPEPEKGERKADQNERHSYGRKDDDA